MHKRNSNCQLPLLLSCSQWSSSICVSLAYLPRDHHPINHRCRPLRDQDPLDSRRSRHFACTVRTCPLTHCAWSQLLSLPAEVDHSLCFLRRLLVRELFTVVLSRLISLKRSPLEGRLVVIAGLWWCPPPTSSPLAAAAASAACRVFCFVALWGHPQSPKTVLTGALGHCC